MYHKNKGRNLKNRRKYGYSDSVFRDNLFEYIIKEVLQFPSTKEYYDSDIFKNYTDHQEMLSNSILIGDVKKFKIYFDVVVYSKEWEDLPQQGGDFVIYTDDEQKAKANAFFELAANLFKKGYVLKKLEVTKIEEIK